MDFHFVLYHYYFFNKHIEKILTGILYILNEYVIQNFVVEVSRKQTLKIYETNLTTTTKRQSFVR